MAYIGIRKKHRSKKNIFNDVATGVHPCLIKRPSIILPEDFEDIQRTVKNTEKTQGKKFIDFSDTEDEDENKIEQLKNVNKSQDRYLKCCMQYNITPLSTFYKQLQGKSVILKDHLFIGNEFKACVVALFCSDTVTQLDIEGDHVGPSGVAYLGDLLYHKNVLVELNLTKNAIETDGLTLLEEALDMNYSLLPLDLSDNNIQDSDCEIIRKIIEGDNLIRSLSLSHNIIGNVGGQHIAKGIAQNDEIKVLNLSWNKIRGNGASAIGHALAQNTSIEVLNVSWNGFEAEGAHGLAHGIENNYSLKELDISSNRIKQNGLVKFVKGLQMNSSLEAIKIADNPISVSGAFILLQLTEKHEKLSYLDFGNQPVSEEFEAKISEIRKNKKLVVKFGKIFAYDKEDEADGTMYISGDPRLILLEFARIKQINLLDMFKTFEFDGSHTITWDEFRQGIKQNQIPLRAKDIEKVIQSLDINLDGDVDFSELAISQRKHRLKVERLQEKGDDVFSRSPIGVVNAQLRKWMDDNSFKLRD